MNMSLCNFKAIKQATFYFDGKDVVISGKNGSGKTTIYEAYYWCLFGKTLSSNGVVQMLDKDNNIVHNVETSVDIGLRINDSYNIVIKRTLSEKWKSKRLMGTETKVSWNNVPVSLTEYKSKIEDIVPIKLWQLLSNNAAFMNLKTDERRKMLLSLARNDEDSDMVNQYPCVAKAFSENKTLAEFSIQTKNQRKTASKELSEIPAKILAQEALKVRSEASEENESLACVEQYYASEKAATAKIDDYKATWNAKQSKEVERLRKERITLEEALSKAENIKRSNENEQQNRIAKLAAITEQFNQYKSEWLKINDETFDFENSDICPICGTKLSDEFKHERHQKAVEDYNRKKSERLDDVMRKAQELSQQKSVLAGSIKVYNEITSINTNNEIKSITSDLSKVNKEYQNASAKDISQDEIYCELCKDLELIKSKKPSNAESIIQLRTNEEINKRIEAEKKNLQKRSMELSQVIADCDKAIDEIFEYRKAELESVQKEANSLFANVQWKFYTKNVTNDELQEICECIVNGVDYNNLNKAAKVNAEIDIINAISKHYDVALPCWIDNKESVSDVMHCNQQQIMLEVVKNKELSIN